MSDSLSRYKYGVLAVAAVFAYGASHLIGEEGDEGIIARLAAGDDAQEVAETASNAAPAPRTRVRTTPRSEEITPEEFYGDPEPFVDDEFLDTTPEGLTEEYNQEGSRPTQPTATVPPRGRLSPEARGLAGRR